ncbi:hypothetical protein GCM10010528_29540 [Gordonia defluvii]|uniref:Uncharacterized protein n=1 Tax=Gordonia defluvii TaxID=283718 RepID=A0ABP6LK51_9ACTN
MSLEVCRYSGRRGISGTMMVCINDTAMPAAHSTATIVAGVRVLVSGSEMEVAEKAEGDTEFPSAR